MKYELSDLTIRGKYALFWNQWASNWTEAYFTIDGTQYNCVEQYMMAEKARLFDDNKTFKLIMQTKDPAKQKKLGRKVSHYNENTWVSVRYQIVLKATIEKYRQNPGLLEVLLSSGDLAFVEASPNDTVWGIGLSEDDKNATRPGKWRGQNLLGKAICEARSVLRNGKL